jgi:hypothetical protein
MAILAISAIFAVISQSDLSGSQATLCDVHWRAASTPTLNL